MIDTIKYAIISDIYIKDLICFNPQRSDEVKAFCLENGITYVPGEDRKTCYRLENDGFVRYELTEDLKCSPTDRLFDQKTIDKFESGSHDEVLFVMDNDCITGVVHIIDYNNEFINVNFYHAVYLFEVMLRKLLVNNKESNQSIIEWMKDKGKSEKYWLGRYNQCVPKDENKRINEEQKRKDFGDFQTFYLNDLIHFVASKGLVSEDFTNNLNAIVQIRNWVAHNKDLTHRSSELSRPLYLIKELKDFVRHTKAFIQFYEELELKLAKSQI
ncbi:MAG: hypothetical protein R3250_00515 [Melioribacteraceae bacterium]|nr:hypothetical protein [Melioribacteraceae bacterium]